ncbi:MAG: Type 1 glutamine amidotransferase-like domain-containing protein [Patescibacteria group bacterium]
MRLYLSSYKFGNFTDELVKLVGTNKRAAVIMNALDYGDPVRVSQSLEKQIAGLASLGFAAEQLDLRNYFGKKDELAQQMKEYGLVWVHGGNSFVLKRAYEQSGFDLIVADLVQKDELVYGGFSAAVVVITPTLKGVEIVDDPDIVPPMYQNEISLQGLGLIDYVVAVHYKSDHPESSAVDQYVEFCEKEKIPYKTLRDGEVIVVRGSDTRIHTL